MSEPFLRELWERKAERERGETREERAFKIYQRIKNGVEKKPELLESFKKVEEAIFRYDEAISKLSLGRIEQDTEAIYESDRERRLIHNAMESWLNLLSRQFAKAGLDNSWRDEIGQREALGRWAYDVVKFLREQREEKYEAA